MGVQDIDKAAHGRALRAFTTRVLRDLHALDAMVRTGALESGIHRIGAEQEVFLVDAAWRAAPVSPAVLAHLGGRPGFVPELGKFQAEINLDPLALGAGCLSALHTALDARLAELRDAARAVNAELVLTGILPTLRRSDLTEPNLTARPRYFALADAIESMRGEELALRIEATDELVLRDRGVMLEAATASFQVHLQVDPRNFAPLYNAAQAVAGAQLAAAANSPLLFGARLWHETRVPLFQQAADTRTPGHDPLRKPPRVAFGAGWVRASPVEVLREDVTRFPILLVASGAGGDDPLARLARGEAPDLLALRVHTSTVYRWNRVCYGTADGVAHVRIENRVLPAGPTTLDEVANAALWIGLLLGVVDRYGDIAARMAFDDAKANFYAAARAGLGAQLAWVDGTSRPAPELLRETLVPLAREGLLAHGVLAADVARYLDVIDARVAAGRNGARWLLASDAAVRAEGGARGEQLAALVAAVVARQWSGEPVHRWTLARLAEAGGPAAVCAEVEQVMTTDVPTVRDEDAVALAGAAMQWAGLSHVPVEDATGALVGLLSQRALMAQGASLAPDTAVRAVMEPDPPRVAPETATTEVLATMRARGVDCVLVVREGRLVGLVTAESLEDAMRTTA